MWIQNGEIATGEVAIGAQSRRCTTARSVVTPGERPDDFGRAGPQSKKKNVERADRDVECIGHARADERQHRLTYGFCRRK